jgi:hypothetical protein
VTTEEEWERAKRSEWGEVTLWVPPPLWGFKRGRGRVTDSGTHDWWKVVARADDPEDVEDGVVVSEGEIFASPDDDDSDAQPSHEGDDPAS